MAAQLLKQRPQPLFVVGQRSVVEPFTGLVERDRVMVALANIEPAVHVVIRQRSPPHHAAVAGHGRAPEAGSHVTKRPTRKRPCPYQRSTGATETGDNTPRIIHTTGGTSHTDPGDQRALASGPPRR
jgi:hypothetical protein